MGPSRPEVPNGWGPKPYPPARALESDGVKESGGATMMILVAYASKHGATAGIARRIAERLTERGHVAEARSVDEIADLGRPDAVVLGSAVYAGSWRKEAVDFVERHNHELARIPVWLFSSGPLGDHVDDDEEQPRQLEDIRRSIAPRDHRTFFGALNIGALSFGERMIVKAVKAPEGDFRNWEDIDAWADGIDVRLDADRAAGGHPRVS
jgi:menaquinone-dependent protoporphyrinogen oxidase